MLSLYLGCLAFGGVLVAASVVLGHHDGGAGDGEHGPHLDGGAHDAIARIAHQRGTGVRNQGDVVSVEQPRDELTAARHLVILVHAQRRCGDPIGAAILFQMTGVLGSDQVNLAQHPYRTVADVLQVAYWQADNVQRAVL